MKHIRLNKNGFMLFELVITVALLAFIILLGVGIFSGLQHILVHLEAQKLAVTCRCLQYQAQSSNSAQQLFFEPTKQSYYFNNHHEKLVEGVQFGRGTGVIGTPSRPNQTPSSPITFVQNRITFFPQGILQAGTVYLTSREKAVTYALSTPISQVSFLRIYRYNGKWSLIS